MSEEKKATLPSFEDAQLEMVPVDQIGLEDETYRFRASLRTGPLVTSIEESGIQIPVVLRKRKQGQRKYQIISGFRRITAAVEAELEEVPALIREMTDEEAFAASVLENTSRKTYSDVDRGYVILAYKKRGYSSHNIGEVMGLTSRQVNNLKSLIDLPEHVQEALSDDEQYFTTTHALVLKKLAGKYPQLEYAGWIERINERELSVATLTREVNSEYKPETQKPAFDSIFNAKGTQLKDGEFRLSPVKVSIKQLSRGERVKLRGELEELLKMLSEES